MGFPKTGHILITYLESVMPDYQILQQENGFRTKTVTNFNSLPEGVARCGSDVSVIFRSTPHPLSQYHLPVEGTRCSLCPTSRELPTLPKNQES
jgi:hypothetical protein